MSPRANGRKKWLWRLVHGLILALLVWGVSSTLQKAFADLGQEALNVRPGWLVLAGLFYLLGLMPAAIFWQGILWALGQRPTWLATIRAYYIGHLGKYVPGKAMVVIMRAALVKGPNVDPVVAAVSVFPETLTMMSVGAFLSAGILLFVFPQHELLIFVSLALMLVAGLPTLPPVFRRIVRLLPSKVAESISPGTWERLTFRLLGGGWLGIAAGWCVLGWSLWATLRALGVERVDPLAQLPLLTASVALAMVAGFLSLIPGGMGVRELVLLPILAPHLGSGGDGKALAAAVLLRLVWLMSELLISGILYIAKPSPK